MTTHSPHFLEALRLVRWLLSVALLPARLAHADGDSQNARLHGHYAFTQIHFCLQTNVPGEDFIGPTLRVPAGGATMSTRSNEGLLSFHGDGTGSFDGKTLTINHNAAPGSAPVSEAGFTCPLTYAVNDDGSFTTQLTCVSPAGDVTISGLELHGQLQSGGQLLIANDTNRNVETITSPGGVLKRFCGRSQTAIRVDLSDPR